MDVLHVCLNVSDADELAEWYQENFGYEHSWELESEDGKTRNVFLADENGMEIQLSDTEGVETFEFGTGWDHFAVSVDDLDSSLDEIDHDGVVRGPEGGPETGARVAFIEDPDGHVIELIQTYE